jgi:hypothetical protein
MKILIINVVSHMTILIYDFYHIFKSLILKIFIAYVKIFCFYINSPFPKVEKE